MHFYLSTFIIIYLVTSFGENVTGSDSGEVNIALMYSTAELYFEVLI